MIKVQFQSQIDGISAKKDRTLSIKLGTQEMTADDTSYLFDQMNKIVYVVIAETSQETIEIPEILPEFKGDKSPSQRLRGIIYKIWEEKTDKKETFPRFYESKISQIGEWLKEKYLS